MTAIKNLKLDKLEEEIIKKENIILFNSKFNTFFKLVFFKNNFVFKFKVKIFGNYACNYKTTQSEYFSAGFFNNFIQDFLKLIPMIELCYFFEESLPNKKITKGDLPVETSIVGILVIRSLLGFNNSILYSLSEFFNDRFSWYQLNEIKDYQDLAKELVASFDENKNLNLCLASFSDFNDLGDLVDINFILEKKKLIHLGKYLVATSNYPNKLALTSFFDEMVFINLWKAYFFKHNLKLLDNQIVNQQNNLKFQEIIWLKKNIDLIIKDLIPEFSLQLELIDFESLKLKYLVLAYNVFIIQP